MLLAWSGFHLESRRRRHVPVLQDPWQVRRDNAIVLGVCLLMIVVVLLAGTGLVWWVLSRDPHRHHGLPLASVREEAEGAVARDRGTGCRAESPAARPRDSGPDCAAAFRCHAIVWM